jgi:hypothetical protein
MTLPVYSTGTVSVTHLGTTVTGAGGMWSGINAREGDYFVRADGAAVITEVTDVATLQITPWPGATVTGGSYAIQQNYVGRVVGVAAAEDVGVMLEKLHVDGLPFIVGADETVPDPSYGDEGQLAFQPTTGLWWVKSGGVWVPTPGIGGGPVHTQQIITAGSSVTVLASDSVIAINKTTGSPTAVVLPASSSKTVPVLVVDWKGDAATNPITVTLTGADKFNAGLTSWIINSPGASYMFTPLANGAGYAV